MLKAAKSLLLVVGFILGMDGVMLLPIPYTSQDTQGFLINDGKITNYITKLVKEQLSEF